jgi:hypothetical protein
VDTVVKNQGNLTELQSLIQKHPPQVN